MDKLGNSNRFMGTTLLHNVQFILWPMLFSIGLSVLLTKGIIHFAPKWGWVDTPNHRSAHTRIVPTMGGIAIVVSFLFAFLIFADYGLKEIVLWGSALVLGTIGALDDKLDLSAKARLLVQISLAFILVWVFDPESILIALTGLDSLPWVLSFLFHSFLVVGYINAFNFIDGIDGLSGSFTVIACLILMTGFLLMGNVSFALLYGILLAATIGFLIFNWPPAKIFMGDSGSTVLGLLLVVGALELFSAFTMSIEPAYKWIQILPFIVLVIPIFDLIRTLLFRRLRGQSFLNPDKTHLHHLLIKTGLNHLKATLLILLLQIVLIIAGVVFIGKFSLTVSILFLSIIAVLCTEGITIFFLLFNYNNYMESKELYDFKLPNDNQFIERNI